MGFMLLTSIYNTISRNFLFSFLKALSFCGVVSGIISIFSIFLWYKGYYHLQTRSLLGMFLNLGSMGSEAQLIFSSLNPTIVSTDYVFGKPIPRFFGFEVYPTAMGALSFFSIVMSLAFYKITRRKILKIVIFFEYLALFTSLSRIAIIAAIFCSTLINIFLKIKKYSYFLFIQLFLLGIILSSFLLPLTKIWSFTAEFRKGSTEFRKELYEVTLKEAIKKPILGHGIKPRAEKFPVPVGSHSMYLGVIFKTGFVGFFTFSLFWLMIFLKWWKLRFTMKEEVYLKYVWFYSGVAILGGLLWMFSEDIDAPSIVTFIYFLIIGILVSLNKLKNQNS